MDEDKLEQEEAYLLRSKLHIRCGFRRLNQNKYSAGMATIYDALVAGMHWFVSSPQRVKQYTIPKDEDLYDDKLLYSAINSIKELSTIGFEFKEFHSIMELGLDKELSKDDFNANEMINYFTQVMTKIGVMPFNFDELSPENPDLF